MPPEAFSDSWSAQASCSSSDIEASGCKCGDSDGGMLVAPTARRGGRRVARPSTAEGGRQHTALTSGLRRPGLFHPGAPPGIVLHSRLKHWAQARAQGTGQHAHAENTLSQHSKRGKAAGEHQRPTGTVVHIIDRNYRAGLGLCLRVAGGLAGWRDCNGWTRVEAA